MYDRSTMSRVFAEADAAVRNVLADRYAIERPIGEGGASLVFLAHDRKLGRPVALKVLRDPGSPKDIARFLAEIRATAWLQHPFIQPLHDFGEVDGIAFYAMPFIEGESLRARLKSHSALDVAEAFRFAGDVAEGLAYAHEKGFVHRDITPENILVSHGHAIIADFGIMKAMMPDAENILTGVGYGIGSPYYMSPEQMASQDLDGRSDVYSLGYVLYEMLTGHPPFRGPSLAVILRQQLKEPPPRPSIDRPDLPAEVDGIVTKAMAVNRDDRYATAGDFAAALRRDVARPRSFWARLIGS